MTMTTPMLESEPAPLAVSLPAPDHLWAVLLAGGDGIRMQALTRRITGDSRPKQFCRILGGQTLFEQTRSRLEPLFPRSRQVFVLSRHHEKCHGTHLTEANGESALVQPMNRGTGIAMILAVVHILERDPDAVVGFFPCDQYYSCDDSFRATVRSAAESAYEHPDSLIVVGAEADYPEVEYGWVEPEVDVVRSGAGPLSRVNRFWEKPSLHVARALLHRGCLWNTFVTVGRATTFLEIFCSQVPQAVISVTQAITDLTLESGYHLLHAVDFSRDVLTHQTRRLQVLRDRTSGWADLGSPARILDTLMRNGIKPDWVVEQNGLAFNVDEGPGVRP